MALSVTHTAVVVVPDDGTSPVGSDEWNDTHTISGTLPAANVAAPGSDTQVIFNGGGALATDSGLTFASATDTLSLGKALSKSTTDGDVKYALYNNTGTGIGSSGAQGGALAFFHGGGEKGRVDSNGWTLGAVASIVNYLTSPYTFQLTDGGTLTCKLVPTAYGLEMRDGTNANSWRVYNTYTDASNYERGVFDWTTSANTLTIGTQQGGTGNARDVYLKAAGADVFLVSGGGGLTVKISGSGFQPTANNVPLGYFGDSGGVNAWQSITTRGAISWNVGSTHDVGLIRAGVGILAVTDTTTASAGVYRAAAMATLYRTGYRSVSADITMSADDSYIIMNKAGTTASVTLTTATAALAGREIYIKNLGSTAIVSGGASANVVPLAGGATAQAIVAGTAGKFAKLYCDGTTWHIMEAN